MHRDYSCTEESLGECLAMLGETYGMLGIETELAYLCYCSTSPILQHLNASYLKIDST